MAPNSPGPAARRPVAAMLSISAAALFLLCGYEFVRSVSTSLYIEAYGARNLPWVMALSPVGTLAYVYGYGWLLSRLGARRTLVLTSVLSGIGIAACYLAIRAEIHMATTAIYLLRESYIVLIIEQYWSYINSTLDSKQAKRFNGPICGVASLGAISGGLIVGRMALAMGSEDLLLIAALSLVPAALFGGLAFRLGGEPAPQESSGKKHRGHLALDEFRKHRTLVLLALLIAATQAISTVLDLRFSGLLEEAMPSKNERTAYLGNFYATLNTAAFALQFVAAPLLLRWIPLRLVHLAIPAVHIASCALLLAFPTLSMGAAAYLIFKALDYSIFRAGKEILYIPLPFDARYRAKEVIDAFGYRASKGATSGLAALAGLVFGRLPGAVFALMGIIAAAGWFALMFRLVPRRVAATADGENP